MLQRNRDRASLRAAIPALLAAALTSGCGGDAGGPDGEGRNGFLDRLTGTSKMFKTHRRTVVHNGSASEFTLAIEGRCEAFHGETQLQVTCMTGPDDYVSHFVGLSGSVFYFIEHVERADGDSYPHRITRGAQAVQPESRLRESALALDVARGHSGRAG